MDYISIIRKIKLFYNISIIAGLIGIFLLQSGCNNRDKWKAVPLKIKKQESYNYSEMISGDLDSTEKAELEEVRKNVAKENKNLSKHLDELRDETNSNFFDSIWKSIKNIYNWFLDLF